MTNEKTVDRFMSKIKFFNHDGCWEWHGKKFKNGYSQFSYKNIKYYGHRFSYMISKGEIPKGMDICHSCDVRHCVNPDHLWVGTRKQNMMDCVAKKRDKESRKTHCKHGHPFSGENLRIYTYNNKPRRYCVMCLRKKALNQYYKNEHRPQI
jgi:hypothetical protein